jgi:hypothetical protein
MNSAFCQLSFAGKLQTGLQRVELLRNCSGTTASDDTKEIEDVDREDGDWCDQHNPLQIAPSQEAREVQNQGHKTEQVNYV